MVHFHRSQSKDGEDGESPAGDCVDDAVGVLQPLHGFPSHTHGMIVSRVEVRRVTAAENCGEEKGQAEDGVDTYDDLDGDALPFLEKDAIEGYCKRGLEEDVCKVVEGELEDLVLLFVRIEHLTWLDVEGLTVT